MLRQEDREVPVSAKLSFQCDEVYTEMPSQVKRTYRLLKKVQFMIACACACCSVMHVPVAL